MQVKPNVEQDDDIWIRSVTKGRTLAYRFGAVTARADVMRHARVVSDSVGMCEGTFQVDLWVGPS